MKMNRMIFPLALALAATLATTGCKHGPNKVTPLPGMAFRNPTEPTDINTKPFDISNANPNPTVNPTGTDPGSKAGQLATENGWRVDDMNPDRAALASYTVHFAFDSAVVKKGEDSNISAVASALAANASDKLLIEGNCDERGTEEYNRSLGERRALALREALHNAGVDEKRIRTISYGKDKPVDPGHDEAAFAKNRRGDFILLHPKAGV